MTNSLKERKREGERVFFTLAELGIRSCYEMSERKENRKHSLLKRKNNLWSPDKSIENYPEFGKFIKYISIIMRGILIVVILSVLGSPLKADNRRDVLSYCREKKNHSLCVRKYLNLPTLKSPPTIIKNKPVAIRVVYYKDRIKESQNIESNKKTNKWVISRNKY